MKTVAAVLVETGKPLVLADLEIPTLKPGQVLIEIAFSSVCHTQLLECHGHRGKDSYLPHCLGHEATGIVRESGPQVTKCKPDDRVVLSWIKGSGADVPGAVYDWNRSEVNAGGVTTFSRFSVVSENRVTVIGDEIPLRKAAVLGCAVATGAGAVLNTARPQPQESLAVFGTGGIGLCAVAAAALMEAQPIIAIDLNPQRLDVAKAVGATHCVNARQADPMREIRRICPGGVDYAIESSGRPEVMVQALDAVRIQGGAAVIIGNARYGECLQIDPRQLNMGKRLLGTWGGDTVPDRDFLRYGKLLGEGKLPVEKLVSDVYCLSDINEALEDLRSTRVVRPLIDMSLS